MHHFMFYLVNDKEWMHEKKTLCFLCPWSYSVILYSSLFIVYLTIYNNLSRILFFLFFLGYYVFPISGSTVEATTTKTTTCATTTTTSSLGVTINNTTITTSEKMLIVNTGENGSDTNNIANDAPVPTIAENDNSNNNSY